MHVRVPQRTCVEDGTDLYEVILVPARDTVATPASTSPPRGMLRHLLEDHQRSALDLMPCSDRLEQLHRFEHVEADCGLVVVDHVHR